MVMRFLAAAFLTLSGTILFGQILEFAEVQKMPVAVNSAAEEGMPLLSPDGKKLFFSLCF